MAWIGRLLSCSLLVVLSGLGTVAAPVSRAIADDSGELPPVLRIPGFPPVLLPPGTHVFGPGKGRAPGIDPADRSDHPASDIYRDFGTVAPGGEPRMRNRAQNNGSVGQGGIVKPKLNERVEATKPKALTPEEKQTQIRKALTPPLPVAAARRKKLDELYAKLAASDEETEARGIASVITAIWARSGSDTADLLMARAESAAATKNFSLALTMLGKVIELQPSWAEAWNKRASVRYLDGDLNGAMADVDHVLRLEPNHFQALNGLAMILQQTGFDKRALQVYRRELSIYPHQPEIESLVQKLTAEVEGQGI